MRLTIAAMTCIALLAASAAHGACPYDPNCLNNPYSADSINNPYGAGNPYSNNRFYVVPE